jgi:hypothetical protein
MDGYVAPGAAFSGGMEDFLMKQSLMKRQALLDTLAQRKQDLREKQDDAMMKEKIEEGKARRADLLDRANDRDRSDFEKRVSGMLPGDQPDPELIAKDQKFGTGFFKAPQAATEVAGPTQTGAPLQEQQPTGPAVYLGNRADRETRTKQAKVQEISERLSSLDPASPEYKQAVMDYEMLSGKTIPSALLKGGAGNGDEAVARQNPRTGKVERLVNGAWTPITGDVPKGTHFMTEPPPKDTSAAEARAATHRDDVHKTAISELDKWAKPVEDQLGAIHNLGTSLAQKNNPKADALVAVELLKSTVAGNGVRLTQPEITQVLGGSRTKWDALELKLNAWGGDQSKPLVLTDTEKDEIRSLAKALRTKANSQHQKIIKARHDMDDANDVKSLNGIRTKLQEDLFRDDTPEDGAGPGGLPEVGGMFNGGKVTKITRIK